MIILNKLFLRGIFSSCREVQRQTKVYKSPVGGCPHIWYVLCDFCQGRCFLYFLHSFCRVFAVKSRILVKMIVAVLEEMVNLGTRQEVERLVGDAQGRMVVFWKIDYPPRYASNFKSWMIPRALQKFEFLLRICKFLEQSSSKFDWDSGWTKNG